MRDERKQGFGIRGRNQEIGSAGVDGSGFSRKVATFAIHISIIHGDAPDFVIGSSVGDGTIEFGCIDITKVDFPILAAVC